MREILFRGKRCDNGEWVQGYYIRAEHHWHNHGIHKDWITLGASANGGWFALHNKYAVKAETIGQFTGLTDKNGKKIFEGDIAKCCDDVYRVVWGCAGFCLRYDPPHVHGCYYDLLPLSNYWHAQGAIIEVIGNIHDNPELLENP